MPMLEPYCKQFDQVETQLRGRKWFAPWNIRVSYFPDQKKPNGVGIQLAKQNWFNDDGMGIHFETWVTAKEIESRKLKFVMHVLHQDFFPETTKKPWDFLWPFLECQAVIELVGAWKGFKMGRSVPISGSMRFEGDVTSVVADAFEYFQQIGPHVDSTLKRVLGKA
jgi:hypothetical protein